MSRRCCARNCFNSIISNKSVEYFGFPKNEYYAHKWAIAAGREDLLKKPLHNIIKYYLCSSHFDDNCFKDDARKHLKKQWRPEVIVPIPSIFKNNITEFLPENLKSEPNLTEQPSESVFSMKRKSTELSCDEKQNKYLCNLDPDERYELKNEYKRYNVYVVKSDDDQETEEVALQNLVEEVTQDEDEIPTTEVPNQCRLCAKFYENPENNLLSIFDTNEDLVESIERLIPETIFIDDGKPQHICYDCVNKVYECTNIIDSFYLAQVKFDE